MPRSEGHLETVKRVNMAECPSCRRMVAELQTVTSEDGYFPQGTRICSNCLSELRLQTYDVKRRRIY